MKLPKFIKSHNNKENEGSVKLRNIKTANQLSLTNDFKFQPQKAKRTQQSNYYGVEASFVLVKADPDTAFINYDDKASAPCTPKVTISPSVASKLFNFKPLGSAAKSSSAVLDALATPKQLNLRKENLDKLNMSSSRYSKSAQCKRLQRNRPAAPKPSNYMLRSAVLSHTSSRTTVDVCATPVRPFNHLAKANDQVDSRVSEPVENSHVYLECLSDTFLSECRGNLLSEMPSESGRNEPAVKFMPVSRDSPRTPKYRNEETPNNKAHAAAATAPQVTQSAAPLTRFEKLSQFVSRSALKVVNNVAGGSASKSKSNLFAQAGSSQKPTAGSNGSSPSTSMRSEDDEDELNSNVQEEEEAQQATNEQANENNQENNYFQYDQLNSQRSTSNVNFNSQQPGFSSFELNSKPRRPTMGLTALSLKQMKSTTHQNITTAGMSMLPNVYLVSVPIVFNSTDLLSNEEYMSTCSLSSSTRSSSNSSGAGSASCYNHLSRGSAGQQSQSGYLVPQTPRSTPMKPSFQTPAKFATPAPLPATPSHPPPLPPNHSTSKMSIYKAKEVSRANETYDTINDSVF